MRTIKKAIKTAYVEGKNWKQEMYRFLRNYRATPHSTTGEAPATLLFGRPISTKLPYVTAQADDEQIRQRDNERKSIMKDYADAKSNIKPTNIEEGDTVIVKPTFIQSKSQTPYDKDKLIVVAKKGSMITASRGRKEVTRNASFFKKLSTQPMDSEIEESDVEYDDDDNQVYAERDTGGGDAVEPAVETTAVSRYPTRIRRPPPWLNDYARV
jgi:hypothetical protein